MDKLNLLILEDVQMDAEIMMRTLENAGVYFDSSLVSTKSEFIQAISHKKYDAVLADNSLPGFSAKEALLILNESGIRMPFILVTGSIEDEYAVEMLNQGTSDYVLKDRLQRLPNALLGSIQKFRLEKERNEYLNEIVANESLMIAAARLAKFGSWEVNFANKTIRWSDEQYLILGYEPGEVEPSIDNILKRIHPDDFETARLAVSNVFKFAGRQKFDSRVIHPDGTIRHISGEMVATADDNGNVLRINGFTQDVTKVREAELKEKKVTADLLQRNKDLEQFAYIISHNLRSPVANILGLTNELTDGQLDESDRDYFIGAIGASVKRLDTVITDLNNILQVTRNVNENKETVNFDTLVEEIKSGIGTQLEEKLVSIHCDFSELKEIQSLKSYMHSIFYNLISNSIKFRRPGFPPLIEIMSYQDKHNMGLIFKDNGVGIDLSRNNKYLFGLYKRFHQDLAEGKGIGLFMVKSQVETLGGKIFVDSKINEGTSFDIRFPRQ